MSSAAPISKADDLLTQTVRQAKAWGVALTSYIGGIAALVGGYFALTKLFPGWNDLQVLAIAGIPLLLALLTITLPNWLARRRERRLIEQGISGTLQDPAYFRIRPYEAQDRERFWRPDGAHEDVLNWLLSAQDPVLYLTGRSGTGKSSLLNAWVLPRLKEQEPPCLTLVVRSYRDPLAELASALARPGIIWDKAPAGLAADLRERLERAAAYLRGKKQLLIVFDQFEEFVILHEPERRVGLEAFLRQMIERPIPGVTILLVLRSDYLGVLDQLDLPSMRQRDNWREVAPFTQAAAAAFLDRSGLSLGPALRQEILKEAAEIEENPGLIRPITLNMFGLVVSRFDGSLPKGLAPGRLLTGYLRDALEQPEVREHAPRIVREMVTDAGTKHPRSETELAEKVRLDSHLIRGTLLALGSRGLVRPVDEGSGVWEIAHDFVARLLSRIVGNWRVHWWQRTRSFLAPVSLVMWTGAIFIAAPTYQSYVAENAFQALRAMGIQVTGAGNPHYVRFPEQSDYNAANDLISKSTLYLSRIGNVELDLSAYASPFFAKDPFENPEDGIDLDALSLLGENLLYLDIGSVPALNFSAFRKLVGLKNLNIAATGISDLTHLENNIELESLILSMGTIKNIDPLAKLRKLKILRLWNTNIADLRPLSPLVQLEELGIASSQISDITPIETLSNLRVLDLSFTQVKDLNPLSRLRHS
jgi:hypothetical protein